MRAVERSRFDELWRQSQSVAVDERFRALGPRITPVSSLHAAEELSLAEMSDVVVLALVIVRRERATDHTASRAVQAAAFDQSEGEAVEARLLDELRKCDGWLPALSWVAEIDGQIVGHNVCTRGHVNNVSCVGLGPIGVMPDSQHAGIGSALMHAMIGAADAVGEPLIALLGDPGYYSQFGFVGSTDLGVVPPETDWGPHFQVLPLSAWSDSITGSFRYSAPFDEIS